MSSSQGFTGLWCPACDRQQSPNRLVRQMSGKQEGMLLKCAMGHTYSYERLMQQHPRMDQVEFVEKQPPNTMTVTLWIHPEALEALKQKFPQNFMTTMCACLVALADPDTVLIEGEHAREMASIGIRRGKEVKGLAKEVIELRAALEQARIRESVLEPILKMLGAALPQNAVSTPQMDAVVVDGSRNPSLPPAAKFGALQENASGLLVPADGTEQKGDFTFAGPQPTADARPAFVTRNLK